ncbi:MAG: c-type cytochrome [Leptolyngbyaceae cyanobacterium]
MTDNALEQERQLSSATVLRVAGWVGLIAAIVLVVVFWVRHSFAAEPYVQDVLSLTGDGVRGQEIFQMNCAVCHGMEADGEVGPSLLGVSARKSKSKLIQQVVSGNTPPMPQFQPEPQVMADLLDYLEQL